MYIRQNPNAKWFQPDKDPVVCLQLVRTGLYTLDKPYTEEIEIRCPGRPVYERETNRTREEINKGCAEYGLYGCLVN